MNRDVLYTFILEHYWIIRIVIWSAPIPIITPIIMDNESNIHVLHKSHCSVPLHIAIILWRKSVNLKSGFSKVFREIPWFSLRFEACSSSPILLFLKPRWSVLKNHQKLLTLSKIEIHKSLRNAHSSTQHSCTINSISNLFWDKSVTLPEVGSSYAHCATSNTNQRY